ncbi:hypothetical protein FIBSPDRAFT_852401 [Athelia psychrophila]|uniref:Uncharacterized protein n=1 Tax=Athelia psychrophila TaxID=1759441 RepID=A0A166RUI8_9AGAM|nr:hypothetical protein FIBSPDRAFT_852401 [Fibularhizoctonia sp. CBS 109695]
MHGVGTILLTQRAKCADMIGLTASHGGTLTIDKRDNYDATYFFCAGSNDPWVEKCVVLGWK